VQYELIRGLRVPKIGFGTWKIGGEYTRSAGTDGQSLGVLRAALDLGYRHFDTAEMYAAGHSEELLGRALADSGIGRQDVFITSKVTAEHLGTADLLKACSATLGRLRLEYLDLYLIHWPNPSIKLSASFRALNRLVDEGRIRSVGVSNFDLDLLKQAQQLCATPILTDQVPYSVSQRSYQMNGVLDYCQANDIVLTAYSPLTMGRRGLKMELATIAAAHCATPEQILLAWLIAQPRVITIPMSKNPVHQKDNLSAADIKLTEAELASLS
jgi:diketogulonate reductase-like aldo/keto reductase